MNLIFVPPRNSLVSCKAGFTLIELLVTMTIMTVLLSASVPALLSSQRASALTRAGNSLADIASLARQTALSKNTITALIVTTKTALSARQGLLVLEYDSVGELWKPLGNWVRLPDAASVVDMGGFLQAQGNTKAKSLAPLDVKFDGQTLQTQPDASYSALLFYPDGRMENGTEPVRQLSTRYATDSPSAASQSLPNYYDLVVNSNTSAYRILRR